MSKTRCEYFYGSTFSAGRGECLRALIAAIYDTAKANRLFTTDQVFANLIGYDEVDFRKTVGPSKLIAVALRKVRERNDIEPATSDLVWPSTAPEVVNHGRLKRVWSSKIVRV